MEWQNDRIYEQLIIQAKLLMTLAHRMKFCNPNSHP